MAEKLKRCTAKCGELKPLSRFTPDAHHLDGFRGGCKDCHAAEEKARRDRRPERNTLTLMLQRCFNPNHPKFHVWGGRGITVCDEWRGEGGFERFFAHVGPRPSAKHGIDRYPDNNGNYEPGNVRWATQKEQCANLRKTVRITFHDKTLTLDEWAAETGIKRRTLEWRYYNNWPPEQVLRPVLYKFYKKRGASL